MNRREYAISQVSLDTGRVVIHGHTEDEKVVAVWRERKMDRQEIIWREIGPWQPDEGNDWCPDCAVTYEWIEEPGDQSRVLGWVRDCPKCHHSPDRSKDRNLT